LRNFSDLTDRTGGHKEKKKGEADIAGAKLRKKGQEKKTF